MAQSSITRYSYISFNLGSNNIAAVGVKILLAKEFPQLQYFWVCNYLINKDDNKIGDDGI